MIPLLCFALYPINFVSDFVSYKISVKGPLQKQSKYYSQLR